MAHPTTVAAVLKRLEQLDKQLPDSDGVKWFNKLYLECPPSRWRRRRRV